MDNNLFDKEKDLFNEIDIPGDLDNLVNSSVKAGTRKFVARKVSKGIKTLILAIVIFTGIVNISPQVANALEGVPVLGLLSKSLVFDWVETSYKKGAYIKGGYKETIDGITFEITEIVGDKDNLRFEYEIKSKTKYDKINVIPYSSKQLNQANYIEEYDKAIEEMKILMDNYIRIFQDENSTAEEYLSILKEKAEKRGKILELEEVLHKIQVDYLTKDNEYIDSLENNRYFVDGTSMNDAYSKEKQGKDVSNYLYVSLSDNKYYSKEEGNKIQFYIFVNAFKGKESKEIEFKVELELPKEVVDRFERKIEINKSFETYLGKIEIIEAITNITSTNIISRLEDDNKNQEFFINARFINPRLVKENGEEILIGNVQDILYSNSLNETPFNYSSIDEKVIFKADGVRYGSGFESRIAIYPKDGFIKANNYGAEILSQEGSNLEIRLLNINGLELTFDDEELKLINKEVKTIDEREYIYLYLEILNLDEDIVSFGTEVKFEYTPIEIELDFTN